MSEMTKKSSKRIKCESNKTKRKDTGMIGDHGHACTGHPSYTLDDLCTLAVQLVGIASMGLLLAVLKTRAGMGFEHAMLGAEVAVAETAVSDNALGRFLALLETASRLAGRHNGEGFGSWVARGRRGGIGMRKSGSLW